MPDEELLESELTPPTLLHESTIPTNMSGEPSKFLNLLCKLLVLIACSPLQPLRVCAEQGCARGIHCTLWNLSSRPYLAVLVCAAVFFKRNLQLIDCFSHYRAWRMIGLHPMCAIFYTAGYALREYGAFNYLYSTTNLNIYIVSQVMIYICP